MPFRATQLSPCMTQPLLSGSVRATSAPLRASVFPHVKCGQWGGHSQDHVRTGPLEGANLGPVSGGPCLPSRAGRKWGTAPMLECCRGTQQQGSVREDSASLSELLYVRVRPPQKEPGVPLGTFGRQQGSGSHNAVSSQVPFSYSHVWQLVYPDLNCM